MRRILKLDASQSTVIDGNAAETFAITLKLSVTQLFMRSVLAGQLYVFIVTQDGQGKHKFTWGDQLINGIPVELTPTAPTVQCYIGLPGNLLYAIMPGTWT